MNGRALTCFLHKRKVELQWEMDGRLHLLLHGIAVLHRTSLDGPALDILITGSCALLSLRWKEAQALSVLISITVPDRPALDRVLMLHPLTTFQTGQCR